MGTGVRTTLPLVAGRRIDADWKRVKVEQAIGDKRLRRPKYRRLLLYPWFFSFSAKPGASARLMLVSAAADAVERPRLRVRGAVPRGGSHAHRPQARLRRTGARPPADCRCRSPKTLQLKPKSAWRYIGKETQMVDLADICDGKAIYGMDVRREGMVYASIEHPPVMGGKVQSFDDKRPSKSRAYLRP